jgi:hypothetical protein
LAYTRATSCSSSPVWLAITVHSASTCTQQAAHSGLSWPVPLPVPGGGGELPRRCAD